jgi:hypothetical protein
MAYSTIANESTQWNGISILSRKGAIQFLRRKPFLGSYECRTLSSYNYCREQLFRQLLLEIKRRPHYIIIGRLLRQRAKLSHDRLDYLYFSDAGIIQLGRNRRKRKTIRNVLSMCGRQLMADCNLVDIFTTNISVEFQLRVWINCSNTSTVAISL